MIISKRGVAGAGRGSCLSSCKAVFRLVRFARQRRTLSIDNIKGDGQLFPAGQMGAEVARSARRP